MSESVKPKTPLVGRPFIARHTATLLDTDLILLGNTARLVYADLQLFSAMRGLNGRVPMNPRALSIALQLDGGVAEVAEAVEALVGIGKLVEADEPGFWFLPEWSKTQADMGGSETRSEAARKSALARHHRDGKHAASEKGPQADCQLCDEGVPSVSAAPAPVAAPEPAPEAPAVSSGTTKVLDAEAVKVKMWAWFDSQLEADAAEGVDPTDTYLDLAAEVEGQADQRFVDVKGVTATVLSNLLVSHAVQNLWSTGDKVAQGVERQVHGMRRNHGTEAALVAVVKSAGAKNPAQYCAGILKNGAAA